MRVVHATGSSAGGVTRDYKGEDDDDDEDI